MSAVGLRRRRAGPAGAVGSSQSPNWKPVVPQPALAGELGDLVDPRRACWRTARRRTLEVAVALVEHPRDDGRGIAPRGRGARSRRPRSATGTITARRRRRPARRRGRAATTSRNPAHVVEERTRSARTPGCRRSSPAARRAAGSRSARRGSCRACPRRRSRAAGSTSGSEPRTSRCAPCRSGSTTATTAAGSNVAGPAGDLGVAEAVEREARLPGLRARRRARV